MPLLFWSLYTGMDPTLQRFHYPLQRFKYITDGLINGRFEDLLPAFLSYSPLDFCVVIEFKLHYLCNRPFYCGAMVTCNTCGNHYLAQCVGVLYDACPPLIWQGPCCPCPHPQPMQFVPDSEDKECITIGCHLGRQKNFGGNFYCLTPCSCSF